MIRMFALIAVLLLAVLSTAASASATYPGPIPSRPMPVPEFWPDRSTPSVGGGVFEYRLTDAYWSAFKECRKSHDFDYCRNTVPADYYVVRTR